MRGKKLLCIMTALALVPVLAGCAGIVIEYSLLLAGGLLCVRRDADEP